MATSEEFSYLCRQCPRTFKLQDFFEKHQRVHELKKQHVCRYCGYVYGAAKGLLGHLETVHGVKDTTYEIQSTNIKMCQTLSFGLGSQYFQSKKILGSLNQAKLAQESAALLQKAQQAMLVQMNQARTVQLSQLSLVPLSINPGTSVSTPNLSPQSRTMRSSEDKSKIPSPAGTGNYKIYDKVPEINDAGDAQQNESGFFHCTICTREFSGLNSLKKHVPIHTRRVQHKCDVCGYVFGKKEYLLDHMRKHTGEISPVCQVCGQTFNKSLKLKEHQKLHRNTSLDGSAHSDNPFRCHLCKDTFLTADILREHLRSKHSETVYKCDMCDASFGDVRGKNHHMYNEHQLDAFHQKCVWCPVCNQGFTRHYNLKVHMYKSHGKDYLENNFSSDELESLMRPPPGSNTSKASTSPKHLDKDDIGVNTSLPISPPLTPKLSPRLRYMTEDQPQIHLALDLKIRSRPGPASLTKTKHYFEQESMKVLSKCKSCDLKFVYKVDCDFHYEQEHKYEDEDLQANDSLQHQKRKPGPASRTNAPIENRVCSPTDIKGEFGFTCTQCGKVLMHKQSYVSHMRVIHGDYYGGNKWNGSRVVDMVLGDQSFRIRSEENKNYSPNELLLDPSDSGHNKRQSLTVAFDHNDIQEPDTKRLKLSQQEVHEHDVKKNQNNNTETINNNCVLPPKENDQPEPLSLVMTSALTPPTEEDRHMDHSVECYTDEDSNDDFINDRNDDIQFEPVTQEFLFEGQLIKPSYCVLPFVTEKKINKHLQRGKDSNSDDEIEDKMIIDENPTNEIFIEKFNNNNILSAKDKQLHFLMEERTKEFTRETNIMPKTNFPIFENSLSHPFTFSLSAYLQKKKEMSAILVPRFQQNSFAKLTLEHVSKSSMSMKSPIMMIKDDINSGNNTAVSEYENQIQSDSWPLNCIKCNSTLHNLENFNLHMNDHWSDDKCCPVCGLLINSKRFNFKQHLKIHTGEKPFVCHVCSRAFRQKAHMVKHVTTHKTDVKQENIMSVAAFNAKISVL